MCLVDLGDTAEAVTATALGAGTFDCVLIGGFKTESGTAARMTKPGPRSSPF